MKEKIVAFRGKKLKKVEVELVLEFEKILDHQFLIKDEITWRPHDLRELITKAEQYLYSERGKKDEISYVWQLAVSNYSVVGLGLYLNHLDILPEFISEFKSLEHLVLTGGDLEIIPESIGELKSLKILNLRENMIKKLPKSIGNLNSLEMLDLGENQLEVLPYSIGSLNSLKMLWIDNNQIRTLPESFENLKSLKELNLSFNTFERIPKIIIKLMSLEYLSATNLNLEELPDWIVDINSLKSLFLSNNNLTSIPNSIWKLNQLKTLIVDNNNLTRLPKTMLNLMSLQLLDIHGNKIENLSSVFIPLDSRGVNIKTAIDQVFINWDLENKIKISNLIEKGRKLISTRNYNEALKNFEAATELAEKLSNFNQKLYYKAAILNFTGNVYLLQSNYNKSLEDAKEMLKSMDQINDLPGKAVVYNNMGNAYHGMGRYDEALKYYKMGLNLLISQGLEDSPNALTMGKSLEKVKYKIPVAQFKVNEYITLKLVNNQTNIYINNQLFQQCKYLLLNIPVEEITTLEEIKSIDEAAEKLDHSLEINKNFEEILPKTEFWGHCSNIQAWYENNYDSCLLHRNLAFPLLRKLTEAGDPLAKKVFKEEIAFRYESGIPSVIKYLEEEGYLKYLSKDELDALK
jgi:Leucine-rich repeat (LRR) protein